ncbi:MAG TPA: TonB-dependent receptor [Gammaproteobacteria bacterium]|nr:TonB-dependent receptor [Gammaproteobacteria bacterium]
MLQNYYRIPLLFLCTALFAGAAGAQSSGTRPASSNTAPNAKNELEEIVVTATRLETPLRYVPAAVSVVSKNDIQLGRQQLTLAESLDRVPGVFMQDRYNFAQGLRVSIRGFGARANFGVRGVKILIDGIPATLPDGQASADDVDLGTTSRIEVIRGPSSTLYGNASGGVINVTSEPPPKQPFAELRVSGGNYGFDKTQLKGGGQGDKVGYLFSVSDTNYDGFREHSNAEIKDATGRFNVDLGKDRKLLATVSYTDQPLTNDPGGVTAAIAATDPKAAWPANLAFDAHQSFDQTRVGFVYDMPLSGSNSLTARNYYVWRDFKQFLPFVAGGVPSFKRFFAGGGLNFNHDGYWLDRPDKLVVGFDAEDQNDDRTLYDNDNGIIGVQSLDQNENVTSSGLFLQNQLSITKDLLLTLGARYDQVAFDVTDHFLSDGDDSGKVTENSTSPMAGLVYTISTALNVYGKYSTSFETPTTTEFYNPSGAGGFNQSLKPQLATNYEVGMRGLIANRHHYELAVFTVGVKDELIPFEVPGSPGRDYYVNAGKSTRNGLEFSLVSNETNRIRTTFSYTYSDFTFDHFIDANGDNFSGNTIPGTAKGQIYGEISYQDPNGWFGSLEALHIGKQFANNANTATSAPYTLTDVRFGYQLESGSLHLTPFLAVNNLFDERYNANLRINAFGGRFFEAGPGRNLFAGVTINYQYK